MDGMQIIRKEITRIGKALKKSESAVELQRTALREAESVKTRHEKRLRQLDEALATLVAEQDKVFKAAGISTAAINVRVAPFETAA